MADNERLNVQLNFKHDEDGVYDGRSLSKIYMNMAYRLLAAYGDGNLNKTEQLFKAIACKTVSKNRVLVEEEDNIDADILTIEFEDQAERLAAIERHRKRTKDRIEELLKYPTNW